MVYFVVSLACLIYLMFHSTRGKSLPKMCTRSKDFWDFWDFLGFIEILRLEIFGIFWDILGLFEIFWDSLRFLILEIFGIFWDFLEFFGIFWDFLGSFGIFWKSVRDFFEWFNPRHSEGFFSINSDLVYKLPIGTGESFAFPTLLELSRIKSRVFHFLKSTPLPVS